MAYQPIENYAMERPLRMEERVSLGTHRMMCTACSNFRKQIKALRLVAQTSAAGGATVTSSADDDAR